MTFEEFATERMPRVLRFATVLAGDRATAEDLAQEVLIRAYSRWDRIGCLDRPELYVLKMILNEWRRRSSRQILAGTGTFEPASGSRGGVRVGQGSLPSSASRALRSVYSWAWSGAPVGPVSRQRRVRSR
jgi:hypothetical protein